MSRHTFAGALVAALIAAIAVAGQRIGLALTVTLLLLLGVAARAPPDRPCDVGLRRRARGAAAAARCRVRRGCRDGGRGRRDVGRRRAAATLAGAALRSLDAGPLDRRPGTGPAGRAHGRSRPGRWHGLGGGSRRNPCRRPHRRVRRAARERRPGVLRVRRWAVHDRDQRADAAVACGPRRGCPGHRRGARSRCRYASQ